MRKSIHIAIALFAGTLDLFAEDKPTLLPPVSYNPKESQEYNLIIAAFNCDSNKVAALIDAGANVNARFGKAGKEFRHWTTGGWPMNADKFTPLMALAEGHHGSNKVAVARLLLDHKAIIDADDGGNRTALYFAVDQPASQELAVFLITQRCSVTNKSTDTIDGPMQLTALHIACVGSPPSVIDALIKAGADVNARDIRSAGRGWSPLDYARHNKNTEAIRLLLRTGAK